MSEYLLRMKGLSKAFTGVQALDNVDFSIKPREIVCLAGENGSGKSTLVKVIAGAHHRDSGIVEFEEKEIHDITPAQATKLGIQVIYQDLSVFSNLTVLENLAINTEIAETRKIVNWKRMKNTAEEALSKINYEIDLNAEMGDLSIADKQLVAISRALLHNAKLIIMDEPTTALTKREVDALFKTVRQLRDTGIAIMFISHKNDEVFDIADTISILRNGKNVHSGAIEQLDREMFGYYMTGKKIESVRFMSEINTQAPVLEIEKLSLKGKYNDVTLSVRKGEILGITGLLGSGRTELALSMFGLNSPEKGKIRINGDSVILKSPIDAQRHKIGYVPEDRLSEGLFLEQPIVENITVSRFRQLGTGIGYLDHNKIRGEAEKWVDQLNIATDDPGNNASTLSGGNQQRIVLAKWLSNDLDVLILNGPTVGVDIGSKKGIHELLHSFARKGLAVIIFSDDLPEIVCNCSKVLVMKDGLIVEKLEGEDINESKILSIVG